MNKTTVLLLLTIGIISCKTSEKEFDKLEIAKNYFVALDASNSSKMKDLLSDSLITTIPKYEYEVRYSKNDYVGNWLKWDSVFEPTYKVLEMNLENETLKAKVSKTDKRILFFMHKPFMTNYIIRFQNDKIASIEEEYLNFDESTWGKNRSELLNWTKENHPELNLDRFINIQTESGGKKLLKAIELYKDQKQRATQ
jgi:ketosteroid isomerase-like protein